MNEIREIDFRCAVTSGAFRVQFGRDHAAEKFRVLATAVTPTPKITIHYLVTWLCDWLLRGRSLLPKWIQRLFPRKPASIVVFDAREFDFNLWHCPCCGHARQKVEPTLFVHCPKCHELVCAGRVSDDTHFRCHDDCGGRAFCTVEIEHVDGAVQCQSPQIPTTARASASVSRIALARSPSAPGG